MKNISKKTIKKLEYLCIVVLGVAFFLTARNTYARYVTQTQADASVSVKQWKIYVNDTDITLGDATPITVTTHYDANSSVEANKIAPGSTGYFDLVVDPSRINLNFTYTFTFTSPLKDLDLKVNQYAVSESSTFTGTPTKQSVTGNSLTGSRTNNSIFTIRCYFIWDDTTGTLDDEEDTTIGYNAANGDNQATITTNVLIKQTLE